ncbi:MAG: hypothetical protein C4539_06485 [Ignavibacteriales bacterium]|nr:MAG: hypothetical protein C4539_06485 [Ignavibacteriales bacterium]
MKKLLLVSIILFLTRGFAQSSSNEFEWNFTICTADDLQKVSLNKNQNNGEALEGYFLFTSYDKLLDGKIVKGGFNFLDPEIIGGLTGSSFLREQWVNNNLPLQDLETMTSPLDVEKAISFNILPQGNNNNKDSVSLFFKYAIFSNIKWNNGNYLNSDFNIDIHYKLIKIPFGKQVSFDFLDKDFNPFKITVCVKKKNKDENSIYVEKNSLLENELINSASQSKPRKTNLKFDVEFLSIDSLKQLYNNRTTFGDIVTSVKQKGIESFKSLQNDFNKTELPVDIYRCVLEPPFHLYNTQKEEAYKNYKTREEIFKSTYNIILVPISYKEDVLKADLFINYKKINPDETERWTPIKKRITIQKDVGTRISLPKENWSANFTRSGEKYEIFGYSDYERFVNESIIINFEN